MDSQSLDPAVACLLNLARGDLAPPSACELSQLDTQAFGELAKRQQVDALCFWNWRQLVEANGNSGWLDLPSAITTEFRLAYLHHLMRNECLLDDIVHLQQQLREKGIPSIVFKGPALAYGAYPDLGCRPISDVDLCVHESDYIRAVEVLQSLDYQPDRALPGGPADALRQSHYSRQLRFSTPGKRMIELHFRMINIGPPSVSEAWVWRTTADISCRAGVIRVPGPTAMLLHVVLHANQHGFSMLRLLHDIRYALETYKKEQPLSELIGRVRELRCVASVYFGLVIAQELSGASVPEELLTSLRPNLFRRQVFSGVWGLSRVRRLGASRRRIETESTLLYVLEMGTFRDKARYLAGIVRENGGIGATVRKALRLM